MLQWGPGKELTSDSQTSEILFICRITCSHHSLTQGTWAHGNLGIPSLKCCVAESNAGLHAPLASGAHLQRSEGCYVFVCHKIVKWVGRHLKDCLVPTLPCPGLPTTKSSTKSGCPVPHPSWLIDHLTWRSSAFSRSLWRHWYSFRKQWLQQVHVLLGIMSAFSRNQLNSLWSRVWKR